MNLLANYLIDEGCEVTLFAANKSAPDLVKPKFQIIDGSRALTSGLVGTLPMILKFRQHLVTNNYDWVILNCELPELLGVFTPFSNKLILVEHNERPWLGRSLLGYFVRQILAARKSINVSVSTHTLMWPRRRTPDFIIPNMVLTPPSVQISKSSKLKRLVFIGRLTEQKNPMMFIDIVKESGLSGVLIGEGALRGDLQSVIDEKHLPCQIIGQQIDPWKMVDSGDLLVIPSRSEGDGLVFIEAVNNGVPVIVSKIPAFLKYSLQDNFYAEHVQDFITKIDRIKENPIENQVGLIESKRILGDRNSDILGVKWRQILKVD